MHCPYQLR